MDSTESVFEFQRPSHISSCVIPVTKCLSLLEESKEKEPEQESQGSDKAFSMARMGCFDDWQIYDGIISFVCPLMSVCTLGLWQTPCPVDTSSWVSKKGNGLLKWLLTEFLPINFFPYCLHHRKIGTFVSE